MRLAMVLAAVMLSRAQNAPNPQAVHEVVAGQRTTANAAWWGFNEEDSTDALQAAIRSGARRVIVPNMTRDWVVRPIDLASNQELILEDGVVITAKRGEYRGGGDSVLNARDVENTTLRGYGATVRMQKEDYIVGDVLQRLGWNRWFGQYKKAEWRMTLSLRGVTNFKALGLTLRDSGGDGVIVSGGKRNYSKNVELRDLVCDNHYRQGISVISVDGLLVENSLFRNTWGTPPSSGVDIEPDTPTERIRDVVFRNSNFEDNYGDGIEVFLSNLKQSSGDVQILFERCRVSSRRGAGVRVTKIGDDGPRGLVEFRDCAVENTEGYGIKVQDKSAAGARVRFANVTVRNANRSRSYQGVWTPLWLHLPNGKFTRRLGGIDFVGCTIDDGHDRPAMVADGGEPGLELVDVTGVIETRNPHGVRSDIKMKQERVTVLLKEMK